MAITQADLDQLRHEFDAKLASATVDTMNTATAIGAYGERFTAMDAQFTTMNARFEAVDAQFRAVDARFDAIDRRLDRMDNRFERFETKTDNRFNRLEAKLDNRFGWQTFMFATLGLLTLFGDPIRAALGL